MLIFESFFVFKLKVKSQSNLRGINSLAMLTLNIIKGIYLKIFVNFFVASPMFFVPCRYFFFELIDLS